ncbi:MAG: LPS assembly lipoprotein LptE [bacterium]|nr:LPS assembly lipoprotein LptE [bacterium]
MTYFPISSLCAVAILTGLLASCGTSVVPDGKPPLAKDVSIAGYRLGPPAREDGIHTIHIPRVKNVTREPHLELEVTSLLINEFTREQSYHVVPRKEEADGILQVKITEVTLNAVRFSTEETRQALRGVPVEFVATVSADVEMLNARTGEVVWKLPGVRGRYDFIPGADFTESRREAILQACSDLAREICDAASEQW